MIPPAETRYELLIAIIALIIGLLALIIALINNRYQKILLINTQLTDKAKECNNNLNSNYKIPKAIGKLSWLLSSIITAEELLYYHRYLKNRILLLFFNEQSLIDQFYLQLHTTIRVFLEKEKLLKEDILEKEKLLKEDIDDSNGLKTLQILQTQFERVKEFFQISINRNKEKYFEKLHKYSFRK